MDIDNLSSWAKKWKMCFNYGKFKVMRVEARASDLES